MAKPTSSTKASSSAAEFAPSDRFRAGDTTDSLGDDREGRAYVFNDRVRQAVRVALATRRPLLVRGASGWGKSSLAAAAARYLGWKLRDIVVTSRTQARDLLYTVDMLKRLNDAQANKLDPDWRRYIKPGPMWWAFRPQDANAQAAFFAAATVAPALDASEQEGTVVLIDEIDKADPDVPNNLLVPLGSLQFDVEELVDTQGVETKKVTADRERLPLVIITTNDERALPNAFLRRCVQIELPNFAAPDKDDAQRRKLLIDIATLHLAPGITSDFIGKIAAVMLAPGNVLPSPAEFLDVVRAAQALLDADPAADPIREIGALVVAATPN